MGLINCPDCNGKVSENAEMCIHCGAPIAKSMASKGPELFQGKEVGDTVFFGRYPQNADGEDDDKIEWRILAKEGNKILVISEYALDCKPYNTSYTYVTWETCSLRKWLNGTFLNNAFSADEQAQIQNTTVSPDENPEYSTDPGNATNDKVFLLSITEVEKYFTSDEDRECVPTEYAFEEGAYTDSDYTTGGKATCWWWLRSPGNLQVDAAHVSNVGSVDYHGLTVLDDNDCVRPALWINLDSLACDKDSAPQNQAPEKSTVGQSSPVVSRDMLKVGSNIQFGHYRQNKDGKDRTLIDWQVLEIQGNKALLISKYALECKSYNTSCNTVTWENCSLRKWLNGTFLNNAFSADEQAQIQNTTVSPDENPKYSTDPGNATNDKVFLLSITEAEKYFTSDEARKCVPTEYANAQGAWVSDCNRKGGKDICYWWLRSLGVDQDYAAGVDADGSVDYIGHDVINFYVCVRPALWINLDSLACDKDSVPQNQSPEKSTV